MELSAFMFCEKREGLKTLGDSFSIRLLAKKKSIHKVY